MVDDLKLKDIDYFGIKEKSLRLEEDDFARLFGVDIEDISSRCRELIVSKDFRYKILTGEERDEIISNVWRKIESDTQFVGAIERKSVWENGWNKNLVGFNKKSYDFNELVPKYYKPNRIMRLNQDYIIASAPNFEIDYFMVLKYYLFEKYLGEYDSIYEFGCGTGYNLVTMAQLYPQKKFYGLDFVPSSIELVNKIGEVYHWNIKGHIFDMLRPDKGFKLSDNSAVCTIGAIEQLAGNFEPFIQYILGSHPKLCLNVEPTIELYDENNLVDYLAIKFHKKRGYSENYLTRLIELESQNRIEILKVNRSLFGSLYMDGYSYIIWRPKMTAKRANHAI